MALPATHRYTAQEYLALEAQTPERHEFYDGQIYAMAGGSIKHEAIAYNLVIAVGMQLRGKVCQGHTSNMAVKVEQHGLYTFPDLSVSCGRPQFEEGSPIAVLLNPAVVFEILSPSTEAYDRGKKFKMYETIASLTDYLLISQDEPWVQHYVRATDNEWRLRQSSSTDETVNIDSISCELPMAEIYLGVEFASSASLHEEDPTQK